jgi:hypothetical protein
MRGSGMSRPARWCISAAELWCPPSVRCRRRVTRFGGGGLGAGVRWTGQVGLSWAWTVGLSRGAAEACWRAWRVRGHWLGVLGGERYWSVRPNGCIPGWSVACSEFAD